MPVDSLSAFSQGPTSSLLIELMTKITAKDRGQRLASPSCEWSQRAGVMSTCFSSCLGENAPLWERLKRWPSQKARPFQVTGSDHSTERLGLTPDAVATGSYSARRGPGAGPRVGGRGIWGLVLVLLCFNLATPCPHGYSEDVFSFLPCWETRSLATSETLTPCLAGLNRVNSTAFSGKKGRVCGVTCDHFTSPKRNAFIVQAPSNRYHGKKKKDKDTHCRPFR